MKTILIKISWYFCFLLATYQSFSQNDPFLGIPENINLPKNNLGVMTEYTLEVDDYISGIHVHKLYAYGMQGILIYNLNLTNWDENPVKIEFTNEVSGFYDRQFTNLLEYPARIPLIYISDENCPGQIFAVGPDLRLWYINVTDNTPHQCQVPAGLLGYKLLSAKLVFDEYYSRIVCLISGIANNSENSKSWLCTVDLSSNNYPVQVIYSLYDLITDFAINDVVANNIIYTGVFTGDDGGYWALLDRDDLQFIPDKLVSVGFRPGLIKYVHTYDVHQAYCLPGVNPSTSATFIKIYEGDIPSHDPLTMLSPAAGYTCAGFNDYHNHLYLGAHAGPTVTEFNDVYIFQFQNNTSPPVLRCELNTYDPPKVRQNVPLAIESVTNNQVLVMKRHEIIKLNYTGNYPCPYSYQKVLGAYGNSFMNADVTDDSRIFITKLSGGFLEYDISNNPWLLTDHQTGHSVHSSFKSSLTGKKYFYSKDHFANGYLFIDENTGGSSLINYPLANPIGDCIFNPFQNQVLISDFSGSPNLYLKACSEIPGGLNTQHSMLTGNATFNGKMSVSRRGELLLLTGVNNIEPKIKIFDAASANYNSMGEIDISVHFTGSEWLEVLYADNSDQTYFVVGDTYDPDSERSLPETQNTSYFYVLNPTDYPESPYKEINHDFPRFLETMQEGEFVEIELYKAFIAGKEEYFTELSIEGHNLYMSATQIHVMNPITALKLISYYGESGIVDKLFITTWDGSSAAIWTYDPQHEENEDGLDEIAQIDTYISKIDYNEKTLLLYLYGVENDELKIIQMDVLEQFDGEVKELNIHSLPSDKLSAVLVKTNELLFDNENHVIDIPNGGFSSITRAGFAFDRLHLKDKISWFSFPRLERDENNTVPAIPVLEKIRPLPSQIYMENLPLQEALPSLVYTTYINPGWDGALTDIRSTFGYKHTTDNQYVTYQPMQGSILDPSTSITIYPGHENWVGYFRTWPQDPLDALAPVLDNLTLIKHHDWACVKVTCPTMGPGQPEPTCWLCWNKTPLKYADMLILECSENTTFQWGEEFSTENRELQTTEHFIYSETLDYTPIFIELDTIEQPVEMGAFIGEVCIGAAAVKSGDSTIMIRGYMPEDTSGVITFQQYYSSEKALPAIVDEYYVKNQETGIREKRTIDSRERKKFYQVSFKEETSTWSNPNPLKLSYFPNPGPDSGILEYFLPEDSEVMFEIFDVYGRKLNTHIISKQAAGNFSTSWLELNLNDTAQGIFLIKMSACGNTVTTKIIITK
jgi:hypothetical protein